MDRRFIRQITRLRHFRNRFGTHWLVLDSICASQQGVTAHVIRPADLTPAEGVSDGMNSFVEDLGKVIRERDVRAAAILTYFRMP